jgi:hypothetical protein
MQQFSTLTKSLVNGGICMGIVWASMKLKICVKSCVITQSLLIEIKKINFIYCIWVADAKHSELQEFYDQHLDSKEII